MSEKKTRKSKRLWQQRKQLLLDFIHRYRQLVGISPNEVEMCLAVGYKKSSSGNVNVMKQQLVEEGWLRYAVPGGGSRTIVPIHEEIMRYEILKDGDIRDNWHLISNFDTAQEIIDWLKGLDND